MSKIERFQGDVKAFASNAQGLERTVFGGTEQANDLTSQVTAAFLRGWGTVGPSEHPSLEDFNAAMYALSQFIAYQHQVGIPEWHAEQEYYAGSVCTHAGASYQSIGDDNIGNEPPSAQWTPVLTAKNGGEYFQPKNGNLTALAALDGAANRLPYFTAANTLALTALTQAGRDLIGKADVPAILTYLGLGDGSEYLKKGNNLSDLPDKVLSRTTLGVPAGVDKQMCTAWARWTNNGTVCTIQDSFNVSSVTLTSVGQCQVNFSSPMSNANYSPIYSPDVSPNIVGGGTWYSPTIGSVGAACWGGQGSGSGIGLGRMNAQFNSLHVHGGK